MITFHEKEFNDNFLGLQFSSCDQLQAQTKLLLRALLTLKYNMYLPGMY